MLLLGKKVKELHIEDIRRLIEGGMPESINLDYKQELKISTPDERKEFLNDVSAFINTEGGVIVYGIKEALDERNKNTGLPSELVPFPVENCDILSLQLQDMTKNGLQPSVNNIEIHFIDVDNAGYILVLGMHKATQIPHMVIQGKSNKFYRRRASGKYLLDVYELQEAFVSNFKNREQAEKFRTDRIKAVRSGSFIPNLQVNGAYFIHVVPLGTREYLVDLAQDQIEQNLQKLLTPFFSSGYDGKFNIEGYQTYAFNRFDNWDSYCQLFRNAAIEIYTNGMFNQGKGDSKLGDIMAMELERSTIEKVNQCLKVYELLEIDPPYLIMLSLFDANGAKLLMQDGWRMSSKVIDREQLLIPPVIVNSSDALVSKELKKAFDILWQAGDLKKSPFYDDNGNRKQ